MLTNKSKNFKVACRKYLGEERTQAEVEIKLDLILVAMGKPHR